MSMLNRLFSGQVWQRVVLISCFVLLAAACWYLGPWFGFGEARPLEATEPRLVVLLCLLLLLISFWFYLPLFIPLMLLGITLVWVLGPWIQIGEAYPLKGIGNRFVVMFLITLCGLFYGLWLLLRALAVNPRLLDKLAKKNSSSVDKEVDSTVINAVIERGARYMRRIQRTVSFWNRFFGFHQSELPWFLVLGAPGAGKTTMLFSSGQSFPLPEQLSRKGKENPSTENCECIYTNEALFIDTAGKYSGETDSARREWVNLVHALKKHRPVRGINGVIITLSVEDILHKEDSARLDIAATLRARLDELRQQLGVRFPVYVTITKLDLMTGFEAYFRNLTASEREQIWGVTLPWDGQNSMTAANLHTTLNEELGLLQERLSSAMYVRQQEEYDVGERKSMYALPQDFGLLAKGVTEVVQNIFFASRYDDAKYYPVLRGVYFVSSCQQNKFTLCNNYTLLQKWRHLLDNKKPHTPASLKCHNTEEGLLSGNVRGKHYFLARLFSDVIIPDRDLVSDNLQRHSKHRLKNVVGHFATWGITVWLLFAVWTSYQLNSKYLDELSVKLAKMSKQTAVFVRNPNVELLPPLLNTTQSLAHSELFDVNNPPAERRYGLYTGFRISSYSETLYHFFLKRYLLPQLQERATHDLNQAIRGSDDDALWLALKRYLMLTDASRQDPDWLIEKIASDWEQSGSISPYGARTNFVRHLTVLFSLSDWLRYGQKPNQELINVARARLKEKPDSARIWQQMKKSFGTDMPSLTLRGIIGSEAPLVFTLQDEKLLQQGIPGIYTMQGWQGLVKKKLQTSMLILQREDSWITGQNNGLTNPLALHEALLARYLKEYGDNWEHFLNSVRLISSEGKTLLVSQNPSMDIALLRTLVSDNSPLRILLQRAVQETSLLVSKPVIETGLLDQQGGVVQQAQKLNKTLDYREQQLVRKHLENRFRNLRLFVLGTSGDEMQKGDFVQEQGIPLNSVLSLLQDQYTRFVVYNSMASDAVLPPLGEEGARIAAQVGTWPEPVRNIVSPLLVRSFNKLQKRSVTQSVASIANGPGQICRANLQGRYPFAVSDREVSIADFERFFAAGGIVDSWFQQNLAEKVDMSRSPWRYKGTEDSSGLVFFEQVEHIRHLFFTDSEYKKFGMNFEASVRELSSSTREFVLNVDGSMLKDSHGPIMVQRLNWPGGNSTNHVSMSFRQEQAGALPDHIWRGNWPLLRWLDAAVSVNAVGSDQVLMRWGEDDKSVLLAIRGLSRGGKLPGEILREFRCPVISGQRQ